MNRQELEEKISSVQAERERRFNAGENIRHFEEELVELKTQLAEMPIETTPPEIPVPVEVKAPAKAGKGKRK